MTISIKIQNLKCGGCAKTITDSLSKITTISDVNVVIEDDSVSFSPESEAAIATVEKRLLDLGYPPEGTKNSVVSKAKSFVSCATGKINS